MRGHSHDAAASTQNQGNLLGDRSSVRQSKFFRQYESGNTMKGLLGSSNLAWNTNEKEGAYKGQKIYDFNAQDTSGSVNYLELIGPVSTRGKVNNSSQLLNVWNKGQSHVAPPHEELGGGGSAMDEDNAHRRNYLGDSVPSSLGRNVSFLHPTDNPFVISERTERSRLDPWNGRVTTMTTLKSPSPSYINGINKIESFRERLKDTSMYYGDETSSYANGGLEAQRRDYLRDTIPRENVMSDIKSVSAGSSVIGYTRQMQPPGGRSSLVLGDYTDNEMSARRNKPSGLRDYSEYLGGTNSTSRQPYLPLPDTNDNRTRLSAWKS